MARLSQIFAPKDRVFFDLFEAAADNVHRAADLLDQMLRSYPDSGEMARASNLDLMSVVMIQVVGYSTLFLPYQAPPIVMAVDLGRVPLVQATKLTLVTGFASVLVIAPLDYLWWRILGQIP